MEKDIDYAVIEISDTGKGIPERNLISWRAFQ